MFEYKVIPAPTRGIKAKGAKSTQARFANALQTVMNELGAEGWEYQRMDTLPVEERQGLTGKASTFQNMLVFRRLIAPSITTDQAVEIAALIEDQSTLDDAPAPIEDVAASQVADETLVKADDNTAAETPAPQVEEQPVVAFEDRIKETLETDAASFPWERRAKTAKTDADDPQLPAE